MAIAAVTSATKYHPGWTEPGAASRRIALLVSLNRAVNGSPFQSRPRICHLIGSLGLGGLLREDLLQRISGCGQVGQPHLDILARQHHAVGTRVESCVQRGLYIVGVSALVVRRGTCSEDGHANAAGR